MKDNFHQHSIETKQQRNNKTAWSARRSNFVFSSEANHLYSETTHHNDYYKKESTYDPQNAKQANNPQSLRKANFAFGYERSSYETTNKLNEIAFRNQSTHDESHGSEATERMKGMTKSRIYHGRDRAGYTTTNASNYTQKDSDHLKTQKQTEERGKKLKKSNFHFGHDPDANNKLNMMGNGTTKLSGQGNQEARVQATSCRRS